MPCTDTYSYSVNLGGAKRTLDGAAIGAIGSRRRASIRVMCMPRGQESRRLYTRRRVDTCAGTLYVQRDCRVHHEVAERLDLHRSLAVSRATAAAAGDGGRRARRDMMSPRCSAPSPLHLDGIAQLVPAVSLSALCSRRIGAVCRLVAVPMRRRLHRRRLPWTLSVRPITGIRVRIPCPSPTSARLLRPRKATLGLPAEPETERLGRCCVTRESVTQTSSASHHPVRATSADISPVGQCRIVPTTTHNNSSTVWVPRMPKEAHEPSRQISSTL